MKATLFSLLLVAAAARAADPQIQIATPPGSEKSSTTKALEAGARLMQTDAPPAQLDVYLVGFHPAKADPSHQMEAHHFCRQVNEDFAQCALFDGNSKQANLNGIEYIISARLYDRLPQDEKQYWHPHNYEILSGQLIAPGIPEAAEKQLMQGKMNSYGKTFHMWHTGTYGEPAQALPLGEPSLAWSFNHDGEAKPGLVEQRDRRMRVDSAEKRSDRQDLVELARPQPGVEAISAEFPGSIRSIPGVSDPASAGQ
jgi:Protein of unknown function (DUF1264)